MTPDRYLILSNGPRRLGAGRLWVVLAVMAAWVAAGISSARGADSFYASGNYFTPILSYSTGTLGDSGTQTVYGAEYGNPYDNGYSMEVLGGTLNFSSSITNGGRLFEAFHISTDPISQKVEVGESAYFTASTAGGISLGQPMTVTIQGVTATYTQVTVSLQWQASTDGGATWANLTDDGTYAGTATATLTVVNPTLAMNGTQVRMYAQQSLGTFVMDQATSQAATLTVVDGSPVDVTLSNNGTAVQPTLAVHFWANSTAQPAANFTWEKSTDGGATWQVIGGNFTDDDGTQEDVGTATLDISNLTADASGWEYRVTAANQYGSATSAPQTVTVLPPTPAVFTSQPKTVTITTSGNGSIVDFNTAATSVTGVSYDWQISMDGGQSWTTLGNSDATHLQVGGVSQQWVPEIQLRCQATNVWGTVSSQAATLQVELVVSANTTAPQKARAGTIVVFTANPPSVGAFTFQWMKNGKPIKGATGPDLVLNNVQAGDTGGYSVRVTSTHGGLGVATNMAQLQVTKSAPVLIQQPGPASANSGGATSFTVQAQGTATMTYRWKKDGVYLNNGATVKGATTATLKLSNVTSKSAGNYQVVVKNSVGTVTSQLATLTVNN